MAVTTLSPCFISKAGGVQKGTKSMASDEILINNFAFPRPTAAYSLRVPLQGGNVKKNLLRFAPWVALMFIGVVGTPRMANTAPPPERHPHIRQAADALRDAQEELRTGATD